MIKQFSSLGLTSSLLFTTLVSPLAAYGQIFPIQNAEQSVTIRGNNNTVNQSIDQTVIFRPGRSSRLRRRRRKFKSRYYGKRWKKDRGYSKFGNWGRRWDRDDDDWDDDDD